MNRIQNTSRLFATVLLASSAFLAGTATTSAIAGGPTHVITYQGELTDGGVPINDNCDIRFRLWDAASGGSPLTTNILVSNIAVVDGLVTTNVDFDGQIFKDLGPRWLEIQVRCPAGSGSYTTLSPRQLIMPAPGAYAAQSAIVAEELDLPYTGTDGNATSTFRVNNTSTSAIARAIQASAVGSGNGINATAENGIAVKAELVNSGGGIALEARGGGFGLGAAIYGNNALFVSGATTGIEVQTTGTAGSAIEATHLDTDNGNPVIEALSPAIGVGESYAILGEISEAAGSGSVGVRGSAFNPSTAGVQGVNNSGGVGIWGVADSGGFAGFFNGDVRILGNLAKSSGSFKIDHPLDPANMTLTHSFVESPDMMNIYNGNITTDDTGYATVELPAYFDALNMNFRYQLTVIGDFAQAIVAEEISDNTFVVRTDKPSMKVSWQVTGVREDAYANMHRLPVEEMKPAHARGKYLNPDAFGLSEDFMIQPQHSDAVITANEE